MVAYIALKEIKAGKLKLNEVITATPVVSVVQWDESQMYLKAGEQISVDQLLAGLIVMSANDAAVTLAEKFLVMCLISYNVWIKKHKHWVWKTRTLVTLLVLQCRIITRQLMIWAY